MNDLDRLTVRERQVYERHLRGMRGKEIATDVGISLSNVHVTLRNARRRLDGRLPKKGFHGKYASAVREESAIRRALAGETRCARCKLRGHRPGDPIRCLPATAAEYATRRIEAPVRLSSMITGEQKMPARSAL